MSVKKIFSVLFQLPLFLMLFATMSVSYYSWLKNVDNTTFLAPLIITITLLLYFIGRFLLKDKKKNDTDDSMLMNVEKERDWRYPPEQDTENENEEEQDEQQQKKPYPYQTATKNYNYQH